MRFALAAGVFAVAIDVWSLLHRFTGQAAVFFSRDAAAIRMRALLSLSHFTLRRNF
jgi:hypothetical protein